MTKKNLVLEVSEKKGWRVNLEILKALITKFSSARSQSIYIQKRN